MSWDAQNIRETAEVMLEELGFHKASRHITAAMQGDTSRNLFWSRVLEELQTMRGE